MLNYKQFGSGEPLVILHGLFGSLDNWQSIGKMWAKNYRVVLVDLPNHGKSIHTDFFSYDYMAKEVANLLEELKIEKANILGHSMGGKTAMNFSIHFPHLLGKLIVVDIAPKAYPPHHQQILEGLFSFDPEKIASRNEAEEKMSPIISDNGVRMFLLKNLARNEGEGFHWKMNLKLLSKAVNQVIDDTPFQYPINLPTLFIRGEKSNYILDTDFDDIIEKYPQAQIKTVLGAGHWVHAEKPNELFELVENFLRD